MTLTWSSSAHFPDGKKTQAFTSDLAAAGDPALKLVSNIVVDGKESGHEAMSDSFNDLSSGEVGTVEAHKSCSDVETLFTYLDEQPVRHRQQYIPQDDYGLQCLILTLSALPHVWGKTYHSYQVTYMYILNNDSGVMALGINPMSHFCGSTIFWKLSHHPSL